MFNITLQLLNHQCSYLDPTKPLGRKAHRHENRKSFSQLTVDSNTLRQTEIRKQTAQKNKTRPSACGFKQLGGVLFCFFLFLKKRRASDFTQVAIIHRFRV